MKYYAVTYDRTDGAVYMIEVGGETAQREANPHEWKKEGAQGNVKAWRSENGSLLEEVPHDVLVASVSYLDPRVHVFDKYRDARVLLTVMHQQAADGRRRAQTDLNISLRELWRLLSEEISSEKLSGIVKRWGDSYVAADWIAPPPVERKWQVTATAGSVQQSKEVLAVNCREAIDLVEEQIGDTERVTGCIQIG